MCSETIHCFGVIDMNFARTANAHCGGVDLIEPRTILIR